jgi:succinate-semialdehyde dehydrogenase/glutarate-semialdehyde dehydrogenase
VLQVVSGDPDMISRQLMGSRVIRKVSFTGSTVVGKHLARLAADNLQRLTMELGGHAPVLVFDDVDVESVAKGAVGSKFRNAGQICTAPTRFLVHERVHDRFVDAFAAAASGLRVGDGRDPATEMGPCANPRRVEAMERMVADVKERGGRIVSGGSRIGNAGYFFEPTLVADLPDDAMAMNVEPFGPLAVVRRFSAFDEAVEVANRLPYGLAGYVHSGSAHTVQAAADALKVGVIAVNNWVVTTAETPFGGVNDSGYGSEGGLEGMQAYLATKFVHLA